jgi:NTE family protein
MLDTFSPDVIIGSQVAGNYDLPKDDDVRTHIINMVMNKTDYSVICDNGILIKPNVIHPKLTDFSSAQQLIDSGYTATIKQMNEIQQLVIRRDNPELRNQRRENFRLKQAPIIIDNIYINGLNNEQQIYVNRILKKSYFHYDNNYKGYKKIRMTIDNFKAQYFKLVTEDKFESIYPRLSFNENTGNYNLDIEMKRDKKFNVDFGGNISSNPVNFGFAQIKYNYLSSNSIDLLANTYFGKFYSSGKLSGRIDFPNKIPFYIQGSYTLNHWDYFSSSSKFFEDKEPSYLIKNENFLELNTGTPINYSSKLEAGISAAYISDDYYQNNIFSRNDTTDNTTFKFISSHLQFENNTLNYKQYPTSGSQNIFLIRHIQGYENYRFGSTSTIKQLFVGHHNWLQFRFTHESYYDIFKFMKLGFLSEIVISSQELFNNYTSSLLMAPSFEPIPEIKTLFIPNYRANKYIAMGIKDILMLQKRMDLRMEFYLFQPYQEILNNNGIGFYGVPFTKRYFLTSSTLVYHLPIGNISLSLNYYNKSEEKFSFIFNFGYIIFNKTPIN